MLCIPIDCAKQTHTALGCNGSGKVLKKAFPVQNSPEGIRFLIATQLLNRRGSPAGGTLGAERALRALTRHRRSQVHLCTATSNRIHQIVDQIFPGFLDEKLSGIPLFSEASLYLMDDLFSPAQIQRRQDKTLLRQLKSLRLQHAEAALGQLKGYARHVLGHPAELVGLLQTSLSGEPQLYRCLGENIERIQREIAQQDAQPSTRTLSSCAGIVPRVKQTGDPEKSAKIGRVSRRCNHILKDFIVQCGNHPWTARPGGFERRSPSPRRQQAAR